MIATNKNKASKVANPLNRLEKLWLPAAELGPAELPPDLEFMLRVKTMMDMTLPTNPKLLTTVSRTPSP